MLHTSKTSSQYQYLSNNHNIQLSFIKEVQVIGKYHQTHTIIRSYNTF